MGWAWVVKAWIKNSEHSVIENQEPKYYYKTVYEGSEESEAIAAWKKAKADGAGCVVIEDRS